MHTEVHVTPSRPWVALLTVVPVLLNVVQWYKVRTAPGPEHFISWRIWGHGLAAICFAFVGVSFLRPSRQVVKWSAEELELVGPVRRRIVWADNPTVKEDLNCYLIYPRGERGMVSVRKAACSPELADFLRQRMAAD